MNIRRKLHLLIVLLVSAAAVARGGELDELLGKLNAEIAKSVAANQDTDKSGSSRNRYDNERILQNMAQLEAALARDNFDSAQQSLTQLAVAKLTPEAKQLISQLQRELPGLTEKRQAEFVAKVTEAIRQAGEACLAAKKDSDLDATLSRLSALRGRRYESSTSSSELRQRAFTKLDGTIRFVTRWQDYLTQAAAGYDAAAAMVLRELADNPSGYPVLPRSQILAKIGQEPTIEPPSEALLSAVKTLDDLPKTIAELNKLKRSKYSSSTAYAYGGAFDSLPVMNELNQINQAHAAFKAGFYGNAFQAATRAESMVSAATWTPEVIRLKVLLLAEVLPRYLELPDTLHPKPNENPSDFLQRLAADAAAKHDWDRLHRVLDCYRLSAFGLRPPAWLTADLAACAAFIAGRNLEQAGRFGPALAAYQRVLKQIGKFGPIKPATDRAAALAKEHPEAIAEAQKEVPVPETSSHSTP